MAEKKWNLPLIPRILFHPFAGFWEMKHEKMGSRCLCAVLVSLYTATSLLRAQLVGFVIEDRGGQEFNLFIELFNLLLPLALWCAANWSTTTLLDGKGTLVDIAMALAYSLVPVTVLNIPLTVLSHFITEEEVVFYHLLSGFGLAYSAFLIFAGTLSIHEYSALKTVLTIVLVMAALVILLILAMTFITLLQQLGNFVYLFYQEWSFRM